jgi:hypothetical protein
LWAIGTVGNSRPDSSDGSFFQEILMDGLILGQLGMESRGENVALLDEHRHTVATTQHADTLADAADNRGADEDHLQGAAT